MLAEDHDALEPQLFRGRASFRKGVLLSLVNMRHQLLVPSSLTNTRSCSDIVSFTFKGIYFSICRAQTG